MATKKTTQTWSDVKGKLVNFDREGLLDLVHDLYAANKDNQTFLHARFNLGEDAMSRYKAAINRWMWPDIYKNQDYSVAKVKKAITDYKKAIGQAEGLAELMVFYCECATGFSNDVGIDDESYSNALVRMLERALKTIAALPEAQCDSLWTRLDVVRRISHDNLGYGVGEDMDGLFVEHGVDG